MYPYFKSFKLTVREEIGLGAKIENTDPRSVTRIHRAFLPVQKTGIKKL